MSYVTPALGSIATTSDATSSSGKARRRAAADRRGTRAGRPGVNPAQLAARAQRTAARMVVALGWGCWCEGPAGLQQLWTGPALESQGGGWRPARHSTEATKAQYPTRAVVLTPYGGFRQPARCT